MLKRILVVLLILVSFKGVSQDFSTLWEGYFSYFEIRDITRSEDKIYAASENAIFSYDVFSNEIETITTINGLSGESIATIRYSEDFDLLIVGYETGLIEIIFDGESEILSVVDILEKETISPALKKINHLYEYEGLLYISTDYGISVYDLTNLQFGDSYFIGNGGSQITVNQTAIFNGNIYAACGSNNGIKKAALSNPNLIDFQQWTTISNGNYTAITNVGAKLYVLQLNKVIHEIINDNLNALFTYGNLPSDVRAVDGNLIVTLSENVFVYSENFVPIQNASTNEDFDTNFTCATLLENNMYIGTHNTGVLKTIPDNALEYDVILPEGPSSNAAFKIQAGDDQLWVTYGEYDVFLNSFPLHSRGISVLKDEHWNNIPFDSLLTARNLCDIAINPFNPSQVFISSFKDGILELNNEVADVLYNQDNSGLESLVIPGAPNFIGIRQGPLKFDSNGLIWTATSKVDRALKSFDPATNQWQGYSFSDIISDALNDENGFIDLEIGSGGMKWLTSLEHGLIGYNTDTGAINFVASEAQNMPSDNVRSIALDSRNQLWIGTIRGLRVLFNTSGFIDDPDPSVNEIVILENGIPTELLSNQYITDIKVDGSDNKWVGTLDSGVFYFSPDGQETIFQFTKDNSPLPSNAISDISIDPQSGKVYIATTKGLVAFLSGGSKPKETLEEAYVYPNPVRPEYNILGFDDLNDINNGVKISGLTENVNVKITDIEGNLVAEAQSRVNQRISKANYNFAIDGGTGIWNGKNLRGNIVASGVYLFHISDLDSFETKVLKLLIVR
ncbi:two-component regulator propeller domain-containing protein [Psychroserpens sp. SPM9]|uniref:type IX secretion system anionic LPS delivery protein PorZ n=1 Tax=Psychroserpens sp. SPM9 TaxID=2975598 RepID=UPI0021A330AD|nr:two-component regulator propeller domain-containing protein [Psychroserpens sp. SPM9]MDG5490505.1 two-component regulator propeller domain-containing protein [Psychroserpens sp. SPM9]